jgi:hypothetical protein
MITLISSDEDGKWHYFVASAMKIRRMAVKHVSLYLDPLVLEN